MSKLKKTSKVPLNYEKLDYQRYHHFKRYEKYVENMPKKLICQDCGGGGGEIEPVLDYGEGPFIECGWCMGTGLVTPHIRGLWLSYKKSEKRNKNK